MNTMNESLPSTATLNCNEWQLSLNKHTPDCFQLLHHSHAIFQGQLEIYNNGNPLDLSAITWQFRDKPHQFEQWCNLQINHAISISMTYSFQQGVFVIDYLARSHNPTRLDIRHHITEVDPSLPGESDHQSLSPLSNWQHQRGDNPSAYLVESNDREFREGFNSTQWIVLEQMADEIHRA